MRVSQLLEIPKEVIRACEFRGFKGLLISRLFKLTLCSLKQLLLGACQGSHFRCFRVPLSVAPLG